MNTYIIYYEGCDGRQEQVPDQWNQCAEQESVGPVLLCTAEC